MALPQCSSFDWKTAPNDQNSHPTVSLLLRKRANSMARLIVNQRFWALKRHNVAQLLSQRLTLAPVDFKVADPVKALTMAAGSIRAPIVSDQ